MLRCVCLQRSVPRDEPAGVSAAIAGDTRVPVAQRRFRSPYLAYAHFRSQMGISKARPLSRIRKACSLPLEPANRALGLHSPVSRKDEGCSKWLISMATASLKRQRGMASASRALRFVFGCALLTAALLFAAGHAYMDEDAPSRLEDIRIWHSKTLVPGEDYDVSGASENTMVLINGPGSYTLRGSSTYVRVVVQSGGADLNLHNVRIDPGISAYAGSSTTGIIVEDMGGTVRLISSAGLESYIGGYLLAPAIQKDSIKTQLVFETEDSDIPGPITAHRSLGSSSAAIGCTGRAIGFSKEFDTGNIVINYGRIVATGGYESAGIGGGISCCAPIGCLRPRCATWAGAPRTRCADVPNYSAR